MAGKKKSPTKTPTALTPEVVAQVADLKAEADKQVLSKDYAKAVEAYDQAIKLVGNAPEKAELLQKSAGCHLIARKFKEAVKAASAALDQNANSAPALKTRAKAYEQMGFLKQALSDAQAVNKGDAASDETREMEKRLKDAMSVNKAKLSSTTAQAAAAPSRAAAAPSRAAAAPSKPSIPYMVTVKASLEDETRLLHASLMVSYAELYEAVKAKFPGAGPFVLKYKDREGDPVTITCRADIQKQLAELVAQYQRQAQASHAPKQLGNNMPPLRIQVCKVASEAEVPKPPASEMQKQQQVAKEEVSQQAAQQQYEQDEWLVEFARLFSEITGIDPVAHHEHIGLGHEKVSRAVDAALSDEQALPLFDKAADHFKDATCASLIQWGNVHIIRADRQAQALLKSGKALEGKAVDAMLKEYDECEKKFNEALKIKADSWEASGSMGQLEWERAKARMSYVIPAPALEDPASSKDAEQVKEDAAAAVKSALAKLDPKKVSGVQKHVDGVAKWFDKALGFAKAAEEKKKADEASEEGDKKADELSAEQQATQRLQSPTGNMLVMHGNILYEWSQVMAAINKDWRAVLDSAVDKFRTAGAAESDIRAALKNHARKEELDLGPDPEPEKPAEEVKEEKAKAPEAKGLPSLEVKKKAKV